MADLDANFDTYAASFENALPGIAEAFEQAWPTASHLLGQQQLRWWHERALEISKWGRGRIQLSPGSTMRPYFSIVMPKLRSQSGTPCLSFKNRSTTNQSLRY